MKTKRRLIAGPSNPWRCIGIEVITFMMIVTLASGIGLAQGNRRGNGNGNGGGGGGGAPRDALLMRFEY